jgi:hypothetical protein
MNEQEKQWLNDHGYPVGFAEDLPTNEDDND